jgi:hypothetical protein
VNRELLELSEGPDLHSAEIKKEYGKMNYKNSPGVN